MKIRKKTKIKIRKKEPKKKLRIRKKPKPKKMTIKLSKTEQTLRRILGRQRREFEAPIVTCAKTGKRGPLMIVVGSKCYGREAGLEHARRFAKRAVGKGFNPDIETDW